MMKNSPLQFSMESKATLHKYMPAIGCTILMVGMLLPSQGFCADSAAMDTMATNVVDTIFAPWVRKTALALGGGLGVFQSIGAGSFKPFLTWGGIGLLVNFVPNLVNFLSTLGT